MTYFQDEKKEMTNPVIILASSLIVIALVIMTQQQQAQAEFKSRVDELTEQAQRMHNEFRDTIKAIDACDSAKNATLCKMGVMGWSDEDAIFALGLNKSK